MSCVVCNKYCIQQLKEMLILYHTGGSVRFTQDRFFGSETEGSMLPSLELVGGTVSIPFDVTITPSEQSPVSAEGNSVISLHVDYVVFD